MGRAVSAGGGATGGGAGIARRLIALFGLFAALAGLAEAGSAQAEGPAYVERDSVRVVYWGDGRRAAERTLDAALAPLPLPGMPGHVVTPPSTIILAPSREVMDSIARGRTPDWAAGIAIPAQRLIVLPTYGRRRDQFNDPVITLRHELAHIALNDYVGGPVPRWFDEGYATWVSGGWDERSGWQIRAALALGQAPPLDSLTLTWPRGESRARLAYLLSASAVRHLATSRGERAFASFIERWREEGSMDVAMRRVYQMTPPQFEREWRQMVRRRYGWLLALTQVAVFWFAVAVLVLIVGSRRRRSNRERMEALRQEEFMLPETAGPDRDGLDVDFERE